MGPQVWPHFFGAGQLGWGGLGSTDQNKNFAWPAQVAGGWSDNSARSNINLLAFFKSDANIFFTDKVHRAWRRVSRRLRRRTWFGRCLFGWNDGRRRGSTGRRRRRRHWG